jgi:hypothetical protein
MKSILLKPHTFNTITPNEFTDKSLALTGIAYIENFVLLMIISNNTYSNITYKKTSNTSHKTPAAAKQRIYICGASLNEHLQNNAA